MAWRQRIFGRPLRTDEEDTQRIGPLLGIPVLGLDALASASYGPEAALTALLVVGVAGSRHIVLVSAAILLLLLFVFFSYRQTIAAYPNGGGSFTVAKENLGPSAGLVCASALCVDYLLNATVAISAAVGALVSAVPRLLPYSLTLCLMVLVLLTMVNLRGARSTGVLLLAPTCLFIGCLLLTIVIGIARTIAAGGHPVPLTGQLKTAESHVGLIGLWLWLRAFSSGCTAMTGIEAISNGVPLFREPTVRLARRTLALVVGILALLLAGIAALAQAYGISATTPGEEGYQSVLSQLVSAVAGRGAFYYVTMAAVLTVLAVSANTSFADFPRVCRVLAQDGYLPPQYARRGARLVYANGVLTLSILAAVLLVVFGGITDRLIPLFAVGAFLAFTMSQLGMVAHWRRLREPGSRRRLLLNGVGAGATALTLVIVIVSKFSDGAWLTAIVIPALALMFFQMHRYHERIRVVTAAAGALDVSELSRPIVIVPLRRLDEVARKALRFAVTISEDVRVVQVCAGDLDTDDLAGRWLELVQGPLERIGHSGAKLYVLRSPYRQFFGCLLAWLENVMREHPDRHVIVLIPELVHRHWYQFIVNHRATRLKTILLLRGDPRLSVMSVPWYPKRRPVESREV
jgi:amino acid transporter